ncbi:amidohydrolase family protein [Bacillus sp. J33]|uniref:amidohydrolase family protein n=1 Tax=Bacillus sp. J33 TaxID=935836 RepID=UPI0004798129|nr:amidohydrolase family protein [Bacillus sp. J33]
MSLEDAISVITKNPDAILKLQSKGTVEVGKDADLVLLNKEDLSILSEFALGKKMAGMVKRLLKGHLNNRGRLGL